jgi:hypothetical protein
MSKQIGQSVNSARRTSSWSVLVTRQVEEARQLLARSHVSAYIGYLATRSRDPTD